MNLTFQYYDRYTDGSGGCDGCLNWHNVGWKFGRNGDAAAQWFENPEDLYEDLTVSDNNGLEYVVQVLEAVYTDPKYPTGAPTLQKSLKETGKSRADLWALATIAAVEFGVETNNLGCQGPEAYLKANELQPPLNQCNHAFAINDTSCKVTFPRAIKFQTGRADCIPDPDELPYKAIKEESHPKLMGNGQDTVEFFEKDFGFNGEEMVAIMGAHTMGRFQPSVSLFRYTWSTAGRQSFNNNYYK